MTEETSMSCDIEILIKRAISAVPKNFWKIELSSEP